MTVVPEQMRWRQSLRWRLILPISLAGSLALVIALLMLQQVSEAQIREQLRYRAAQTASAVDHLMQLSNNQAQLLHSIQALAKELDISQILVIDGRESRVRFSSVPALWGATLQQLPALPQQLTQAALSSQQAQWQEQQQHLLYVAPLAQLREVAAESAGGAILVNLDVSAYRHQQTRAFVQISALLVSAGLVLLALFYLVLNHHVLRPVSAMADIISRQMRGDQRAQMSIDRDDELGLLARSFHDLTEQLQQQAQHLQQAKIKAEQAAAAKMVFLKTMSHELRTPLNMVVGAAALLRSVELSGRHRNMLDSLQDSAQRLLAMFNNMLEMVELETDSVVLQPRPTQLKRLVEEALLAQQARARDKSLELHLDCFGEAAEKLFAIDGLRLRRVLDQLLDNAVKFTDHGEVRVSIQQLSEPTAEQTRVRIGVRDTGPGIPTAYHEQLFSLFSQHDDAITRQHGGTGLGLALAQKLAQLLGTRIQFTSAPGQGSEFFFELDLVPFERN